MCFSNFNWRTIAIIIVWTLLTHSTSAFCEEEPAGDFNLKNEVVGGVERLTDESMSLATTPFGIRNGNIWLTLGAVGATSLTFVFDKDIRNKLQNHRSSGLDKLTDAGNILGNPAVHLGLAAFVYGMASFDDYPKWKEVGEMMGEAVILADASSFLLKETVGRGRPNTTSSKSDFKPFSFSKNYDSFPSMHTSSSFALASVLAATSESYSVKTGYYLAASFVAFSRAYQNKHWASDLVFGAILGELCGRVVTNYHASGKKISFAPQAYDHGLGLALVGKW